MWTLRSHKFIETCDWKNDQATRFSKHYSMTVFAVFYCFTMRTTLGARLFYVIEIPLYTHRVRTFVDWTFCEVITRALIYGALSAPCDYLWINLPYYKILLVFCQINWGFLYIGVTLCKYFIKQILDYEPVKRYRDQPTWFGNCARFLAINIGSGGGVLESLLRLDGSYKMMLSWGYYPMSAKCLVLIAN